MRADIWDAVEDGTLSLPIDRTFPLEEAAEAQAHMRANSLTSERSSSPSETARRTGGYGSYAGGGSAPVRLEMRP